MVGKKIALITGGSSGLGFSIAKKLAGEGYIPVLVARDTEKLESAVDLLIKAGFTARAFAADVSKTNEIETVARQVEQEFGEIHFLVLNAGVLHTKLLLDYDNMDALKEDIEIDLWGDCSVYQIICSFDERRFKNSPGFFCFCLNRWSRIRHILRS